MKKLLILLLILLTCTYAHATITWTKEWSSADDLTNDFGGDDLEDIQDDIDTQAITSSSNLTLTGDNTFAGTSTFSGAITTSVAQTFTGAVNFDGGLGIEPTTIACGQFTIDTATASGSQAVTGVGFKPQGIIFFATQEATSEASWGCTDGTTNRSFFDDDVDGDGTYATYDDFCIFAQQSAGVYYTGSLALMGSDGFTIIWTKNGATVGTLTVNYIAFLI